jgi:hypothetical protein
MLQLPRPRTARQAYTVLGVVAALWIVGDLIVMIANANSFPGGFDVYVGIIFSKVMLAQGWVFLSSGELRRRAFAILLPVPALLAALFEPSVLLWSLLAGFITLLFATPVIGVLSLAYIGLLAADRRIILEGEAHFGPPLRLILLVPGDEPTLGAALTFVRSFIALFCFPSICIGAVLDRRTYFWSLAFIFVVGLIIGIEPTIRSAMSPVVLGSYLVFFSVHVLLLRYLGFRLVAPSKEDPRPASLTAS